MASHDPYANARLTGYTGAGFGRRYHAVRPRPPEDLADLLLQLAQITKAELVVDLGSGTGLATGMWATRARRVLGIEPLDEMRHVAVAENRAANVEFSAAVAQDTGIADGAADIVTCAQSLHNMEPKATFAEVGRILRAGGAFAAYDYEVPPMVHWEAERAFSRFMDRIDELRERYSIRSDMQQWSKAQHLERMRESGVFRYVREVFLYHTEPCSAERWVAFALSIGHVPPVLDLGLSDAELGLDDLRVVAQRTLGSRRLPWHVSYRVRIAVK